MRRPQPRFRGIGLVEPLVVALHGLLANRLRSFLTMLGIIIGVAAVIVMVSLAEGAAGAAQESIRKLGTNSLYIRSEQQEVRGVRQGAGSGETLRLEDAELLRKQGRYIAAAAPEYRADGVRVEYRNRNTLTDVHGTTPDYFTIRNLAMAEGRAFTKGEVQQKAMVAVVGHDVNETLFQGASPVGKTLRIKGREFRVVGLQKQMGAVPYGNRDNQVVVPISTCMQRLFRTRHIQRISAQAVSAARMAAAEDEIHRLMARAHRLKPGDPPDIRINTQRELIETASEQGLFLTMLLGGIATVSLVVGGIGVMNIMLVSVTERTREIGIRRAVGARRADILYQFLIESVTLCLTGGLLGVGTGIAVSLWMAAPASAGGLSFPMLLSVPSMIAAFSSSALVGLFFGIYPAIKASALDPIQALRHQ